MGVLLWLLAAVCALPVLLLTLIFALRVFFWWKARGYNFPPSPPAHWFFQHYDLLKNTRKGHNGVNLRAIERDYGKFVHCELLGTHIFIVSDANVIQAIHNETGAEQRFNAHHYLATRTLIHTVGPNGMPMLDGPRWKLHRNLLLPLFSQTQINRFAHVAHHFTGIFFDKLAALPSLESVEIIKYFRALTLDVMGDALMQFPVHMLDDPQAPLADAVTTISQYGALVSMHPFPAVYNLLHPRRSADFYRKRTWMRNLVGEILRRKDAAQKAALAATPETLAADGKTMERVCPEAVGRDFLDLMLNQRDPVTGLRTLSDIEIRDEVITFLFASHETATLTLAWAIYWLCKNPHIQTKAQQEIDRVCGSNPITQEDVGALDYVARVLMESARFTPAINAIARATPKNASCELGGYTLPPDSFMMINSSAAHFNPEYWGADVNEFNPDRFLEKKNRSTYYFPFGGGRRECPGKPFAHMETRMVLAMILQKYRVEIDPKKPPVEEATLLVGLRAMHVRLTARTDADRAANLKAADAAAAAAPRAAAAADGTAPVCSPAGAGGADLRSRSAAAAAAAGTTA